MKHRVTWATDYFIESGNQYGFSVHNRKSREALEPYVEFTEDAPIAVQVCSAWLFHPVEGKRNILYWAWDSPEIPPTEVDGLRHADAIAVASSYMIDAVKNVLPDMPVYLCHEGVDVARFPFVPRRMPLPPHPFRFLWVGAPNQRKGYSLVIEAWKAFAGFKKAELYMKTTVTDRNERRGNVVFDSRSIPLDELVALYHSAHCFVFPSLGEGFGLTCAEAMATGLPVIYTPWTALPDLLDGSCGYPLEYEVQHIQTTNVPCGEGGAKHETPGVTLPFGVADVNDLADTMARVYRHYGDACGRGRRAAERIRERFTWAHTGKRLAEIIETCAQQWGIAA